MLKGFHPPIPTPFVDDRPSASWMAENLRRWNEQPIDGYVVLGSNGEAPLLDDAERTAVTRAARASIPPSRAMIVGAGRQSTRATIGSVREAFDLGATAVLVGVPDYFRPAMTDEVLREHYLRVADGSPGPVLVYSVPWFTDLPIRATLFARLLEHDRIVGIKDSSGDPDSLAGLLEVARRQPREVSVLIGNASMLATGLEMGAAGGVLAVGTVAARACEEIARLVSDGRADEAREKNRILSRLAESVTRRHGIGGLKAALDLIGLYGGEPRAPLLPVGAGARLEIAGLLKELGLLA